MSEIIPHDREFRPRLTARREHVGDSPLVPLTTRLGRRGLAQHFARKGGHASVRPAAGPSHSRRVAVKVRTVAHIGQARNALMAHIRYIERDGAGPIGEEVKLFNDKSDEVDGHAFAYRSQEDPHHFRLTINPEDGQDLPDLKAFCRQLVARVEDDLETSVDWVAGAHHDTGRPHIHLVMRGARDSGAVLKIPRDYLAGGIRSRAEAIATNALGPRAERAQDHIITLNRYTPLDRLIMETAVGGKLERKNLPPLAESDALRRLGHLETQGWVARDAPGVWTIPTGLRQTLYTVRERASRETAAARILAESGTAASPADLVPVEPAAGDRLAGAFVGCRFIGPYAGGAHIVVIGFQDGRLGHVRMPDTNSVLCLDRVPEGAVVQMAALPRAARPSDRTVAEIAAEHEGVWSPALHATSRPGDSPAFIQRHGKRVASLAREGVCTALEDGRFRITGDFSAKALQVDIHRWGPFEAQLRVLDDRSISTQVMASGLTWLDRTLGATRASEMAGPFGRTVQTALDDRANQLRAMGLGHGDPFRLSDADRHTLGMREIEGTLDALSQSAAKPVSFAIEGDGVSGVYKGRLHLSGMPFAQIESEGAVTLVKWRPGLEACRGQAIVGTLGTTGLEFRTARAAYRGLGLAL